MNQLKMTAAALAWLSVAAGPALAADAQNYHFVEGSFVHHETVAGSDEDRQGGVRLGVGVPFSKGGWTRSSLEIGMFGNGIGRSAVATGTQLGAAVDVVYAFELGAVNPFLIGGLAAVHEPKASSSSDVFPAIEAGLGLLFGNVRLSVTAQEVFNSKVTAAQDAFIDYRLNVGVVLGAAPAPAPAPARPADADGDGIPDAQDRCPAQPARTADGCPTPLVPAAPAKDTDGDGIDDSKDECPGTLEGLNVDASGCVAAASAQKVVLKGVNFVPSSAELTPDAKTVLDEAYEALAGQVNLNVEISGHTDSMGEEKFNEALSQRRAESVRNYLSNKGIDAGRLTARGYGEGQPIADNKTRAGRQQNRRVELKILN
jgi:OOP family OmpA-OmpF porin